MSKFEGIRRARQPDTQPPDNPSTQKSDSPEIQPPELSGTRQPRKGRPRGKRSDPSFEQVTAYIPKELYRRVKVRILESGRDQDFSEVVADLLGEWLGE